MEENNHHWIIAFLVGALLWALFFHKQKYEGRTTEEWFDSYEYCESKLEEYKNALEEANYNIEDAKSWAWGSYEEMGEALEDLDIVLEP